VPSRKEIQWSQLRVGALVLLAMAVLVGLILLMSGQSGGLFQRKLVLRSYFENAAGLKDGAPVTLEGVTIGNVIHVRVVADRNPTPVEVTMRVGHEFVPNLHVDSTATISQAGVLGDSYVDLSSAHASGPPPANNAELKAGGAPSIQDVVRNSNESLIETNKLLHKVEITIDAVNSRRGTAGELINNPDLYHKISRRSGNHLQRRRRWQGFAG
jgi:phospholipid/cholesterol/gamma-HCH transport system substrate-binding protein